MRKLHMKDEYQAALLNLLRSPSDIKVGANYNEIKRTMPLIRRLEEVGQADVDLLLEESQWELLRDRVTSAGWTSIQEKTLALIDDVVNAEECEVKLVSNQG